MSDSKDSECDSAELEPYILNEKNQFITKKYINNILAKYGVNYKIKNLKLFQMAMTHTSYLQLDLIPKKLKRITTKSRYKEAGITPLKKTRDIVPLQTKSYERLEFRGDAVLHDIIADYIYDRFPDQGEGFMTTLRTQIERDTALSELCAKIGLNKYILISKIIEINNGRENNVSILEDSFEAFMGALAKDQGKSSENYKTCYNFFVNLMEKEIDISRLLETNNNFKDILLRYYHQQEWPSPEYVTLTESGPDHKKNFTMGVKDASGRIIGTGKGTSKKKGEQEASRMALIYLDVIKDDDESSDEEVDLEWSDSD